MSETKLGSALNMNAQNAHVMIDDVVSKSPDLVTAIESIATMYGIPSSNIMSDDVKSIRVTNGNILVPNNRSAAGNQNTIVRSIATALDQISQRVDDKINQFQSKHIEDGMRDETLASRIDPSKGKVVMTTTDADGEPVIVYDSGIIVAAHTPAGREKAEQIRSERNIPAYEPLTKEKPSYFTDEDDITKGISDIDKNACEVECDFSQICNEASYFIDAIAKYGDTRSLGYDVFTAQGYDCVNRIPEIVTEASKPKTVDPSEIKHMKFDNTQIFKAVDCFNKARAAQGEVKNPEDLNMDKFISDPNYNEAIKCLEKQFDCHIALKWIHATKDESSAFTTVFATEYRDKLTVSKSKGFQLHGAPLHIYVLEDGISSLIAKEQNLFGQGVCSILLHEIFHNIAGMIRYQTGEMITTLNLAIEAATDTRDPKTRRTIVERYVDTLNAQFKGKLNRMQRRMIMKNMISMITIQSDEKLAMQYHTAARSDVSEEVNSTTGEKYDKHADDAVKNYTKMLNKSIKKYDLSNPRKKTGGIIATCVGMLIMIGGTVASFGSLGLGAALSILGGSVAGGGIDYLVAINRYKKIAQKYKNSKEMEEYYADLLSATYQLPQRFFIGAITKYVMNDISQETLAEYVKVEKCMYESIVMSQYPTPSERTHAGVIVAKKLLENKGLNPAVKEYCEWIVKNNDKILNSGIDEDYNSHTYDPNEARELDKHIQSLIKNNNITATESAINYFLSDDDCDLEGGK